MMNFKRIIFVSGRGYTAGYTWRRQWTIQGSQRTPISMSGRSMNGSVMTIIPLTSENCANITGVIRKCLVPKERSYLFWLNCYVINFDTGLLVTWRRVYFNTEERNKSKLCTHHRPLQLGSKLSLDTCSIFRDKEDQFTDILHSNII